MKKNGQTYGLANINKTSLNKKCQKYQKKWHFTVNKIIFLIKFITQKQTNTTKHESPLYKSTSTNFYHNNTESSDISAQFHGRA